MSLVWRGVGAMFALLFAAVNAALWLPDESTLDAVTYRIVPALDERVIAHDLARDLTMTYGYHPVESVLLPLGAVGMCSDPHYTTWVTSPDDQHTAYSCVLADTVPQLFIAPAKAASESTPIQTDFEPGHIKNGIWSPDSSRFLFEYVPLFDSRMYKSQFYVVDIATGQMEPIFMDGRQGNVRWLELPLRREI